MNMTTPIDDIWFHIVFYYKFNGIVYNKYPIDVWENFCEFLDGKRERKFGLNWLMLKVLKYSNFNHSCPYKGLIFVKADNISLDDFGFDHSFVPSGRYRVDISFTDGDRVPFWDFSLYGEVSDHRLEVIQSLMFRKCEKLIVLGAVDRA